MNAKALLSELLALSLKTVRSKDMKVRQLSRMRAGKIRKQLNANPHVY